MNSKTPQRIYKVALLTLIVTVLGSCGSTPQKVNNARYQIPLPSELSTPNHHEDNTGRYMSPYTSDLVVAEWVDKAIDANIGSNLGGLIGTHLGEALLSEVPFIGSTVGKDVGEYAGYQMALSAIGGESFLKESTDISFDNFDDMSIYLYKHNSDHPSYLEAVKATMVLYPGLKKAYNSAIINAPRW